jgi:ribosomal protein L23
MFATKPSKPEIKRCCRSAVRVKVKAVNTLIRKGKTKRSAASARHARVT